MWRSKTGQGSSQVVWTFSEALLFSRSLSAPLFYLHLVQRLKKYSLLFRYTIRLFAGHCLKLLRVKFKFFSWPVFWMQTLWTWKSAAYYKNRRRSRLAGLLDRQLFSKRHFTAVSEKGVSSVRSGCETVSGPYVFYGTHSTNFWLLCGVSSIRQGKAVQHVFQ